MSFEKNGRFQYGFYSFFNKKAYIKSLVTQGDSLLYESHSCLPVRP